MQTDGVGRLGISEMKLAGYALQSRWLWLQKVDQDRAWSQLPIQTAPQVQAFFKASQSLGIGDKLCSGWEDRWIDGESVTDSAPCLYHLVPKRIRRQQLVREGLHNRSWACSITGGLSLPVILE